MNASASESPPTGHRSALRNPQLIFYFIPLTTGAAVFTAHFELGKLALRRSVAALLSQCDPGPFLNQNFQSSGKETACYRYITGAYRVPSALAVWHLVVHCLEAIFVCYDVSLRCGII